MKAILFAFIWSLLMNSGQIFWKMAIIKNGGLIKENVSLINNIIQLLMSPYMLAGIFIYGGASIFWIYLISKYELSFIYPLLGMTFIFSLFFGALIFNENITLLRIIGVVLITIGIYFIGKSGQ